MMLSDLAPSLISVLAVTSLLTFLCWLYLMLKNISLKRSPFTIVIYGIMTLMTFILCEITMIVCQDGTDTVDINIVAALISLTVSSVILIPAFFGTIRWQKNNISTISVKEAFDNLPTGLCYQLRSGLTILTNNTMTTIVRDLGLKSPEELISPSIIKSCGRVYSVARKKVDIDGAILTETSAADITEEYDLTQRFEKKKKQAEAINRRLRSLNENIEQVSIDKESLKVKAELHDSAGRSLLIAKRYLLESGSIDKEEMLASWKETMNNLLGSKAEVQSVYDEANLLGIDLDIEGSIPSDKDTANLIDAAIYTQLSNTLRHAGGSKVRVVVKDQGDSYSTELTNDGRQPDGPIVEKGGLMNLRRKVEALSGTMTISSRPGFCMTLIIPKERELCQKGS